MVVRETIAGRKQSLHMGANQAARDLVATVWYRCVSLGVGKVVVARSAVQRRDMTERPE